VSHRKESSHDGARTSRRRFVQLLGATAAVAPLAAVLPAAAQKSPVTAPPSAPPPAQPAPAPAPAAGSEVDPQVAADARALADMIQRRFGDRFDAAQLGSIREDLEGNLGAGRTLRAVALGNADEPDIVFRARPLET